jgi:hypothetical protein
VRRFKDLLKKLFQFNCAELDLGIYRIITESSTRNVQPSRFIEKDLLEAVSPDTCLA